MKKGTRCYYCAKESNSGESSHFWKGGVTELNNFLRTHLDEWKKKTLEEYDYSCFVSGIKGGNFEIHHVKPFNVIRNEVLEELEVPIYDTIGKYDSVVLKEILERVLEEHDQNLGVPLMPEIHKIFHKEYGFDDTVTFRDLLEFKDNYVASRLLNH
ncbi:hypothetical protein D1872_262040 [compost metagenome]